MDNDSLGNRMKSYEMEYAGRKLLPLVPIMARLDGRGFSKFTKDLKRPYDERFSKLMLETTSYLVEEAVANCGYTQSDEITLTFYSENFLSESLFGGRVQKLESILASMATSFFMFSLENWLPKEYLAKLPHFDCRVWSVPNIEEGANAFLWRELDATKNAISMAASHYYSHNELMNKNGSEKQEMLFKKGINFNNYPSFFKRGTYIQRITHIIPGTLPEVYRTKVESVIVPPLLKISNRARFIYFNDKPILKEDTNVTLDTKTD